MTIESQLGYGTVVELFFPAADPSRLPSPEGAPPASPPGVATILVVEDEPQVRGVALAFLHSLGYTAHEAASAEEAIQRLREHPAIDLLFSDIVLGNGMTGVELAETARHLRPDLPVLLTSGYERLAPDISDAALQQFAMLPKPYRKEDLARAVYRALRAVQP
jgi:CheY-like chemotaxis protein